MNPLGRVRVGHKAPYFQCEAVLKGDIQDVSLSTYIRPSIKPPSPDLTAPWLIILFIPAAFSFVCPTEVLAFQNCLDEFKDRNCNVVFISVDSKHSLWHWQNVPRQYGGLGSIDIPLLSDANHRIANDYGVLIEDQGVTLRGMFIIDGEGLVQQVTLNNLTVARSVLEALRLLEAYQMVAKHGILCPTDWKPNENAADTIHTISNTLSESYEDRLANLQREFGIPVTDLDVKHKDSVKDSKKTSGASSDQAVSAHVTPSQSSVALPAELEEVVCQRPNLMSDTNTKETSQTQPTNPTQKTFSHPSPQTENRVTVAGINSPRRGNSSAVSSPGANPLRPRISRHNTYESLSGSHFVLEFADPTANTMQHGPSSLPSTPGGMIMQSKGHLSRVMNRTKSCTDVGAGDAKGRPLGSVGLGGAHGHENQKEQAPLSTPTRLQATLDAIKKMGAGLTSPDAKNVNGNGRVGLGYFDVVDVDE